jgi:putative nucleotidyltransferase with HDIG domain
VQRAQRALLEPVTATLHDLPNPFVSLGSDDVRVDDVVYINDLAEHSGWGIDDAWYVAAGVTAAAVQVLPLLRKGQVWGRCNIFFRQAYPQSPIGEGFVRKVVGSIAVALDKQADREALEREVVRMRAVVAANDALRDAFSQNDVFQQTVSSAERYIGAQAVWLFYVRHEPQETSTTLLGLLEQQGAPVLAEYVVARAGHASSLQERAHMLAANVFGNAQVCGEHLSDAALLAVPLFAEQQRVSGVLVVVTETVSQSDSAFAEALAQAASSALMRLALVTARAQEAAAYRALANFGATIEAINDVDTLMQLGIKQLMAQLELEAAHAYDVHYHSPVPLNLRTAYPPDVADTAEQSPASTRPRAHAPSQSHHLTHYPTNQPTHQPTHRPMLHPAGSWGQHPYGFSAHFKQAFSPTAGVLTEVLTSKQLCYVEDYQHYGRAIQPYIDFGVRTLLVIPVLQSGQVVKIIALSSYQQVRPLGEERLAIARSFVRRLENAIERVDNVREVESTREATLRALGLALEYRDFETKGHSERVVDLSLAMADELGFENHERQALRWGAYLHDIGKVGVPDSILLKPAALTEEEFAIIKKHTVLGYSLCRDIPFLPTDAIAVVRSHHERWDGSGYPDNLPKESIPLMARLFSLVDVYDALTNPRVYKHAWDTSQALQEIRRLSGRQFDPELTQVFLEMVAKRRR